MAREAGFSPAEIAEHIAEITIGGVPFCVLKTHHFNDKFLRLERMLVDRALQKKIVCLEESILRSHPVELACAKTKYGAIDTGYWYGLETEGSYSVVFLQGLLINISPFVDAAEYVGCQLAVAERFTQNSVLRGHIEELAKIPCPCAAQIIQALSPAKKLTLRERVASISDFKNHQMWFTFVCKLAELVLIKDRPESMQNAVKAYIDKITPENMTPREYSIQEFLSGRSLTALARDPRDENYDPVATKFLVECRKCRDPEYAKFLKRMARALPLKVGAAVLVGAYHFPGIVANAKLLEAASKTEEKKT